MKTLVVILLGITLITLGVVMIIRGNRIVKPILFGYRRPKSLLELDDEVIKLMEKEAMLYRAYIGFSKMYVGSIVLVGFGGYLIQKALPSVIWLGNIYQWLGILYMIYASILIYTLSREVFFIIQNHRESVFEDSRNNHTDRFDWRMDPSFIYTYKFLSIIAKVSLATIAILTTASLFLEWRHLTMLLGE